MILSGLSKTVHSVVLPDILASGLANVQLMFRNFSFKTILRIWFLNNFMSK